MPKRKSSFDVTPRPVTLTDFRISQPLIKIRAGSVQKFYFDCDFRDDDTIGMVNGVDKDLLDYFIREHVFPAMQKFGDFYRSSEAKYRGIATSLFPVFTHLAPHPGDELFPENVECDGWNHEEFSNGEDMFAGLHAHDAHKVEGASQVLQHSFHPLDRESREKIDFTYENEDATHLGCHQVLDIRTHMDSGDSYTILVCDSKKPGFIWDPSFDEDSVMYQLAHYASCAGIVNMEKGWYKPIHMMILGDGEFAVAVLYPKGYFMVDEDNQIVESSFDRFMQFKRDKWCQDNSGQIYARDDDKKLALLKKYQARLNKSQESVRRLSMNVKVPSTRKLLVGCVVHHPTSHQWMRFPITVPHDRFRVKDYTLMAGLLRVLYGDRVLSWKEETLKALAKAREEKLAQLRIGVL